jgi:hypothetical protein
LDHRGTWLLTALAAADPGVGKDRNYIPPVPLGHGFKLPLLVLDGLLCRWSRILATNLRLLL